jgi:thiamine-phosphate pyrophosphorylase
MRMQVEPAAYESPPRSPLARGVFWCVVEKSRAQLEGLYVITEDAAGRGLGHIEVARAALSGGASAIQLRDKERKPSELVPIARSIRLFCKTYGASFIVNDYVEVAAESGADGVHVGQLDAACAEARRALGPEAVVGVSVSNVDEALKATADGADYVALGPIFATLTKPDAGDPIGLDALRELRRSIPIAIVAIGGITAETAASVIEAGADAVAVVSAVTRAADMVEAAKAIADSISKAKRDE